MAKAEERAVNFEALYVNPTGSTSKAPYAAGLAVLLAAAAFYYFLVFGRTGQFALLMLLYPALVLHARRLRAMGKPGWLVLVPGAVLAATAWFHLYGPGGGGVAFATGAAVGIAAVFILWGLLGKDGVAT
jgi:uncharacterized membrane protein YhaH (DUF805 family)